MKKQKFGSLILCCICFVGCNFSSGFKKDLSTGLSYKYSGLTVQNVFLVDPTNQIMSSNKVRLNTKVAIVAVGIENYGLKDGKVYPGMELIVTDKNGKAIINASDLFTGDQGHLPEAATELRGDITVAKPMISGETYHVKLHIWDKVKTTNEINATTDLAVQ